MFCVLKRMSLTCENTHFLLTARRKKTKEKKAKYNRRVVKVRYLKQISKADAAVLLSNE